MSRTIIKLVVDDLTDEDQLNIQAELESGDPNVLLDIMNLLTASVDDVELRSYTLEGFDE